MNVRRIRTRRAMSQSGLARAAGISVSYLSRIEGGQATPSLSVAQRLADVLDVTLTQLTRSAVRKDAQPRGGESTGHKAG